MRTDKVKKKKMELEKSEKFQEVRIWGNSKFPYCSSVYYGNEVK